VSKSPVAVIYGPVITERSYSLHQQGRYTFRVARDASKPAIARALEEQYEAQGVKVSKLIVVGVSYSGFANAELVASQPRLHPAALVMIDSYLDLAARFAALPLNHPTRAEIEKALGGTPEQVPAAYASRSPSHHLATLAADISVKNAKAVQLAIRDAAKVQSPAERVVFVSTSSLYVSRNWASP